MPRTCWRVGGFSRASESTSDAGNEDTPRILLDSNSYVLMAKMGWDGDVDVAGIDGFI